MSWLGGLGPVLLALVLLIVAAPALAEALRRPVDARARREASGDVADLGDGQTYYEWRGPSRGPVVVCVHGLSTPSYVWAPLAVALALKGFRVLTYDLYGRGLSDRPAGVQDSAFFLRQLKELLENQQISSHVTLMGYSMGGAIATAYAARHPALVDKLVLLAPAGLGHRLSPFLEFCRRVPVLGDAAIRLFGSLVHRTGLPMLAVWGEDDAIIPLSALGRLTQLNRHVRQVSLPGAGHSLPFTHPRQIMDALSDFLSDASL